jgi:hypothetical protein
MVDPSVDPSFDESNVQLTCRCGWTGDDSEIADWAFESERDRVVRCCPDCNESVPEGGALAPIDGAARIARGPLREALADAGYELE